jgi:putative phosphoesterase
LKKILLLSDTHNYLDEPILRHASEADEVWHAGDIGTISITDRLEALTTVRAVYGNADDHVVRMTHPYEQEFIVEELKVYMVHIGGYPPRYIPEVKKALSEKKPGLFICGHSHILKVMRDSSLNLLHMNPGAAGIQGFHKVRTMLRFKVSQGKILEPEVIELGQKGKSA